MSKTRNQLNERPAKDVKSMKQQEEFDFKDDDDWATIFAWLDLSKSKYYAPKFINLYILNEIIEINWWVTR